MNLNEHCMYLTILISAIPNPTKVGVEIPFGQKPLAPWKMTA